MPSLYSIQKFVAMHTSLKPILLLLAASAVMFTACETDDVTPEVSLEASQSSFDVSGGSANIVARLNGPVKDDVGVSLSFSGSASPGEDYLISSNQIVVLAGRTSGLITLTGIASGDTSAKVIDVSITSARNAFVGSPSAVSVSLIDCLGDFDGDGVPNCEDECPTEAGPPENNGCPWLGLRFNEVLYDPPQGIAGDSNGDGVRQPQQDEFVEFYNSNFELDISGYTISDDDMVRHVFPPGTIVPSKGVVVVFGGGNPTGTFGGAIVQTASTGGLSLNRDGDTSTLRDAEGNVLDVFDINQFDNRAGQSYTRNPDITGDYQKHTEIPATGGAFFSPGTRLDGSNFVW